MLHELVDIRLKERLTAGDFNEPALILLYLEENIINAHGDAFLKGIGGVAPGTPEIARRKTDEDARQSYACRFALNTKEDLVNNEGIR